MAYQAHGLAKRACSFLLHLCLLLAIWLAAPAAYATMTFTVTKTTITVTTTPGQIGGLVTGHTWSGYVGPIRYRDKKYITSGELNGWGGATCRDIIVIRPCPAKGWDVMEEFWITYQGGSSTKTFPRTDTDWQPNDVVCEGIAQKAAFDTAWLPSAGEITPVGLCADLPDPNPEHPISCSITPAVLTLPHGTLASTAVQGATTSGTATVLCNRPATVKVQAMLSAQSAVSTIPVRADSSITSHLTVNGVDGVTGALISAPANQPVNVNVVSTLSSTSPTGGALSGSAIVLANGQQKPISITGNVTVPVVVCSVTPSRIPLGHGTLDPGAVQGNRATASPSLRCDGDITVNVRAIDSLSHPTATVPLRSDGSITTHLTVNNVDGATGATVKALANQPINLTLVSTLSASAPTVGALAATPVLVVGDQVQFVDITGSVVSSGAGKPKPVLNMALANGAQSNLNVTWGWSTSSTDYGSDTVPENYHVGLFIRNDARGLWHTLKSDSASSPPAPWGSRVQRFHDAYPTGQIEQEVPHRFQSGVWCVKLAAASTPDSGGQFLPAPGSVESCVTVP